jgi:hypothetical protein
MHEQPCARGCLAYRRHLPRVCRVNDGKDGAWVPVTLQGVIPGDVREMFFDADTYLLAPSWRAGVFVTRYGALEVWHRCTDWLAADLEPGQTGAGNDKIRTSRTPPAALNLTVYELRQDLAAWFSHWIAMTCIQFDLTGPNWWRQRVDVARRRRARGVDDPADWRAQLPHGRREIQSGRRLLVAWLDRIEADSELVLPMFEDAELLMRRVQQLAPWEARPRNLRGIACPECERDALALFEGCDFVECRRCDAVYDRDRYDIWSEIAEAERLAS